jgi:putative transposase
LTHFHPAPEGRKNMPHSLAYLLLHVIFSTKNRAPDLSPELATRLFPYMGGIVRECNATALIVNGPADHVHLRLSIPATTSVADMLRVLKANSSRWYTSSFRNQNTSLGKPDTAPSP